MKTQQMRRFFCEGGEYGFEIDTYADDDDIDGEFTAWCVETGDKLKIRGSTVSLELVPDCEVAKRDAQIMAEDIGRTCHAIRLRNGDCIAVDPELYLAARNDDGIADILASYAPGGAKL